MSLMPINIEFDKATFGYPTRPRVIDSLTCTIEGPGLFRLGGPNGSGKSTLLEAVAGHLPLSEGRIRVCGNEAVGGRQDSVAFVRTTPSFAHRVTMRDHCLLFGGNTSNGIERISQLTNELSIQEYLDFIPSQLSSGTKRKFWLALGLLRQTPVLLMDEPFNELDAETTQWLLEKLEVAASTRLVIVVSHLWPSDNPTCESIQKMTSSLTMTRISVPAVTSKREVEM